MPLLRPSTVGRLPAFARLYIPQRSFQSCRILAAGKESQIHNENRAQEAEAAKQEQLKKVKQGTNEWHDALATDSEEDVKADRHEYKDSKDSIAELEKQTAQAAEEEFKKNKGK